MQQQSIKQSANEVIKQKWRYTGNTTIIENANEKFNDKHIWSYVCGGRFCAIFRKRDNFFNFTGPFKNWSILKRKNLLFVFKLFPFKGHSLVKGGQDILRVSYLVSVSILFNSHVSACIFASYSETYCEVCIKWSNIYI